MSVTRSAGVRPTVALFAVLALALAACTSDQEPADPNEGDTGPGETATVRAAGPAFEAACDLPTKQLQRLRRGYMPGRSPEIVVVPKEPNYFGGFTAWTHSGPWDYVQKVPVAFYGPGFIRPRGDVSVKGASVADISPTLAELLRIEWPQDRPGVPIDEALVPDDQRGTPKLILVVVWDGGGWNVLDQWPDAWPNLKEAMRSGTTVTSADVGSSPSVTPSIHASIGTGTFPKQHGIVDIPIRRGDRIVGSWDAAKKSPRYLESTTLADIYDLTTNNDAKVAMIAENNWHLGMIGHGSYIEGGDKDIAAMVEGSDGSLVTSEWYSLPDYLADTEGFEQDVRTVDQADGQVDSAWMGHDMLTDPSDIRHTPVWALFQTRLLKELMDEGGFGQDEVTDLIYTNYKQIDLIGHDWNMISPEQEDAVEYSDDALGELIEHLNATVGRNEWVIAMTADHGQSPKAEATGAWPITIQPFMQDTAEHFDVGVNDLFQEQRPGALWLNRDTLEEESISEREVAEFILDYRLEDNASGEVPEEYRSRLDEKLMAAAYPYRWMPEIWERCVLDR
jgi:arylsulfatase A-like enzyme